VNVAVLGCGTMGPGIAVAFAAGGGHRVTLWGRTPERLDAALAGTTNMTRFLGDSRLRRDEAIAGINGTCELAEIGDADIVVEAVAEHLETKRRLLADVEAVCRATTLLATNTSGLRVTDIAAPLRHRERVVAMHFWNPAHLMPLVEIAGGEYADTAHVAAAVEVAGAIGKVPVVLRQEVLGFLGVRMQQAVVREAIALLDAGVASAADIDLAVRTSFGLRFPVVGPLASADLSGLDVIAAIHDYLLADLDQATAPQAGLRDRVARGDLGVKSGRGFHDWSGDQAAAVVTRRDDELLRRLTLLASEKEAVS
jgi:3-hydroxybutyryl-CoA dehydrogenase